MGSSLSVSFLCPIIHFPFLPLFVSSSINLKHSQFLNVTEAFVVCEGFRSMSPTSDVSDISSATSPQVQVAGSKVDVDRDLKIILPFISIGDLR